MDFGDRMKLWDNQLDLGRQVLGHSWGESPFRGFFQQCFDKRLNRNGVDPVIDRLVGQHLKDGDIVPLKRENRETQIFICQFCQESIGLKEFLNFRPAGERPGCGSGSYAREGPTTLVIDHFHSCLESLFNLARSKGRLPLRVWDVELGDKVRTCLITEEPSVANRAGKPVFGFLNVIQ